MSIINCMEYSFRLDFKVENYRSNDCQTKFFKLYFPLRKLRKLKNLDRLYEDYRKNIIHFICDIRFFELKENEQLVFLNPMADKFGFLHLTGSLVTDNYTFRLDLETKICSLFLYNYGEKGNLIGYYYYLFYTIEEKH